MSIGGTRLGRGGQLVLAAGVWLAALAATANAQFFGSTQGPDNFTLRPPRDVPSVPPAPTQSLIPPSGNLAPKGPLLQSLPAAVNPGDLEIETLMVSKTPVQPLRQPRLVVGPSHFGKHVGKFLGEPLVHPL